MKYLVLILISLSAFSQECPNPFTSDTFKVRVERVVDGDTFEFLFQGEPFHVRVLDLDTYESRKGKKFNKQDNELSKKEMLALGKKAKHYADSLLKNNEIVLIRDRHNLNLDVYGRLLRRVIFKDKLFDVIMKEQGFDSRKEWR